MSCTLAKRCASNRVWCGFAHYLRNYSQYPPNYIPPIYKKNEQQALFEGGKYAEIKYAPVRAAQDNQSSSVFHDIVVQKMINYITKGGRKSMARSLMEQVIERIKRVQLERYNSEEDEEEKQKIVTDPLRVFKVGIANCRPLLKLGAVKRGGQTYQVPIPISDTESTFRAMKWMVVACRYHPAKDKGITTTFVERLADLILDSFENKGRVVKQKLELHKLCEANRAYAHFRWS